MSSYSLPHIMIVDDSRIVRATIIKRIHDNFDVREECDGEDGWSALLVDPAIQLVITDHSMPRLDGYGLIKRIRASRVTRIRDMPVIMISGDDDETAIKRAKDLGATDFITKGTSTAELLSRLDALMKLRQSHATEKAAGSGSIRATAAMPQQAPRSADSTGQTSSSASAGPPKKAATAKAHDEAVVAAVHANASASWDTAAKWRPPRAVVVTVRADESANSIDEALNLIVAGRLRNIKPHVRRLAARLVPLLRLIGTELGVEAAVAEIERKLQ
jgi:DNA-binding response OmpR family regulator